MGFKTPPPDDKAYVILGTGYRTIQADDISGQEKINIIAGPLDLDSDFFTTSNIEFRRIDPETGKSIPRPKFTPKDPNGIFSSIGVEQGKFVHETDRTNFNRTTYWILEVNAGKFHLFRQFFQKGKKNIYIQAVKNDQIMKGSPVFEILPGETAYIGDWLVAQGTFLSIKYPELSGQAQAGKLYLAHTKNVDRMSKALSGQGDVTKVRVVPIHEYTPASN
tara:strand:- start:887 stop:1546 length:660 start_codon:yes stop_codon:yes gene_type:complete